MTMNVRDKSASTAPSTGITVSPQWSKLIDTTTCIGCKACEVACQEWNDLGLEPTTNFGSYQTLPDLTANYWNLIRFVEDQRDDGQFAWLMRKDQCMHCETAGCLEACPAPGAIVKYTNGIVEIDQDLCIGCGYCIPACPFDIPRLSPKTGRAHKCTLCVDRVEVGLEPACVKSCPTGCLQFGDWNDLKAEADHRVAQLQANGFEKAAVYGDNLPGVGGRTMVLTVLAHGDRPEAYGLPANPQLSAGLRVWQGVLRPAGWLFMGLAAVTAALHYLRYGPKAPDEGAHDGR